MSRYLTYADIAEGKLPSDFGVSKTSGSSMTIPGQGSDLAQIISSIVKLPPLDERTFDSPSGVDPDVDRITVSTELDSLYPATAQSLAEDADKRIKARKKAVEAKAKEEGDAGTKEPDDANLSE